MYKTKLKELCDKKKWELPIYTHKKNGPDHMPRFTATVTVKGQVFETPEESRSVKEAQNTAAGIAFEHFKVPSPAANVYVPPTVEHFNVPSPEANVSVPPTVESATLPVLTPDVPTPEMWLSLSPQQCAPLPVPTPVVPTPEMWLSPTPLPLFPLSPPPSSLPHPPPGLLQKLNNANTKPANGEGLQKNCADTPASSEVNMIAIDKGYKVGLSLYKNQLQEYAKKEDLGLPMYTTEAQGPSHKRRFKSKVCVDRKSYETAEFFPTLKEAKRAAAKVALLALSVDVIQEDGVLYKNLLQEFAQKKGLLLPSYETGSSGMSHRPVFVSTVTIGTDTFRGVASKTKKQAEMNAAKVAYFDVMKGYEVTNSTMASTIPECSAADCLSPNIQPTTTKKCHETTIEEHDLHAKRAKVSPENMNMVPPYHLEQPSNEQYLRTSPFKRGRLVFPQELNWPIPKNANDAI